MTYLANIQVPPKGTPIPRTMGEAKKSPFWEGFHRAIYTELETLERNKTWEFVDIRSLPKGTNILRSKMVFDLKYGPSGEFLKFKARMVAMGFTQVEGVDYFETFAGVVSPKSLRVLLSIWNCFPEFSFEHWDVKSAFTNAPIEETVYVHQVPGFEKEGTAGKVLLLRKALYGTKQAARAWKLFLSKIFLELGARVHLKDECVYIFREGSAFLIIGTHVDDIFSLFNEEGRVLRDRVMRSLRARWRLMTKALWLLL